MGKTVLERELRALEIKEYFEILTKERDVNRALL